MADFMLGLLLGVGAALVIFGALLAVELWLWTRGK